jgi:antitoxin MazE
MVIQIKKWGNSLGLRIPRDIARTMGLEEGSEVSLEVVDGQPNPPLT